MYAVGIMGRTFKCVILAAAILLLAASPEPAQTGDNLAPGAPGRDAQWTSAGKEAVGTSNTLESKVWFTLRGGVMDEVYYPTVDVANTRTLQFFVTGCAGPGVSDEGAGGRVEITDPQSLSFQRIDVSTGAQRRSLLLTVSDSGGGSAISGREERKAMCRPSGDQWAECSPS